MEEKKARDALKQLQLGDGVSRARSVRSSRSKHRSRHEGYPPPPPLERGLTDSFYANDMPPQYAAPSRAAEYPGGYPGHAPSPLRPEADFERRELIRRHTEGPGLAMVQQRRYSTSSDEIDMDLAYGELPPPVPMRRSGDEAELRGKFMSLQRMLDEANCMQYSVTATIERLQKDPDALAAVALTLAEISKMAGKMAPAALASMKTTFPAGMALLASPQFMIAAGVGVGVTIVALGGYKIIKRIKERKEQEGAIAMGAAARGIEGPGAESGPDELQELDIDMSRIERWRHGIADAESKSVGTTVDGEFITPNASRRLIADGVIHEDDIKSTRSGKSRRSTRSHRSHHSTRSKADSKSGDKAKKKKEPSGLRMLFK